MLVKKWIIPVSAAVVVLAGLLTGAIILANSAKGRQAKIYETYSTMQENVQKSTLTVLENGKEVGVYHLPELGIQEATAAAVDAGFDHYDRMEPATFKKIPMFGRLMWVLGKKPKAADVPVSIEQLDLTAVEEDLNAIERQAPQDAYMAFESGSFVVHKEQNGTQLKMDTVRQALADSVKTLTIGTAEPTNVTVELTEHDCYLLPEKTVDNTTFDYAGALEHTLKSVEITVDFQGETEVLGGEDLADILSVDKKGKILVDEEELGEIVERWHQDYRNAGVPYLFNAQVGGIKPIDFLIVDYEINQEATVEQLAQVLVNVESVETEPVWYCWYKDQDFSISGEYVEIDIPNQKMTYVKDNEVVVSTDVVTGATWGYPTPPGLYKVENKDTNCWLSGEDYNVHVDYWIGFIGYTVGIHDADWRTKFGGENYVRNGSHGCVNTPKEAVIPIFENIEVGVPVLVYGK